MGEASQLPPLLSGRWNRAPGTDPSTLETLTEIQARGALPGRAWGSQSHTANQASFCHSPDRNRDSSLTLHGIHTHFLAAAPLEGCANLFDSPSSAATFLCKLPPTRSCLDDGSSFISGLLLPPL